MSFRPLAGIELLSTQYPSHDQTAESHARFRPLAGIELLSTFTSGD